MSGFLTVVDAGARALLNLLTPGATLPSKLSGAASAGVGAPAARIDHQHGSAIVGVTDGSIALEGEVGEVISSVIPSGSAVAMPNNTLVDITSIPLTKGHWIVDEMINVYSGDNATASVMVGGSSGVSATLPSNPYLGNARPLGAVIGVVPGSTIPGVRREFNLSAPATVYLVGRVSVLAVGTAFAYGSITAERIR